MTIRITFIKKQIRNEKIDRVLIFETRIFFFFFWLFEYLDTFFIPPIFLILSHSISSIFMPSSGNADASILSPVLLGLAATATLLALAVAGVLAALYRKHTNGRGGQSPKHAPIAREPTHAGVTTPIHPQIKQTTDDMDPDIIPNEYGELKHKYTYTLLCNKRILSSIYLPPFLLFIINYLIIKNSIPGSCNFFSFLFVLLGV